jgi:hypothetical protein
LQAIQQYRASLVNDPANVRRAAHIDHTTSEDRKAMPSESGYNKEHAQEGVEVSQRGAGGDLQTNRQPLGAMDGRRIKPKRRREMGEEAIVQTGASFQEKVQMDEHANKFMEESSSQSAPLTAETVTSGQVEMSKLATASAANSIRTDAQLASLVRHCRLRMSQPP